MYTKQIFFNRLMFRLRLAPVCLAVWSLIAASVCGSAFAGSEDSFLKTSEVPANSSGSGSIPNIHRSNSFREAIKSVGPAIVRIETVGDRQSFRTRFSENPDRIIGGRGSFSFKFSDNYNLFGGGTPLRNVDPSEDRGGRSEGISGAGNLTDSRTPVTTISAGVIISERGIILANALSLPKSVTEVRVHIRGGMKKEADVIGRDRMTNILLLKIRDQTMPFPHVRIADEDSLPGDWVLRAEVAGDHIVYSPMFVAAAAGVDFMPGKSHSTTSSNTPRFQIVQPTNDQFPPGPVFDPAGRLVGFISLRGPGRRSATLMLGASHLKPVVSELQESGELVNNFLGFRVQSLDRDIARAVGLDNLHGALVVDVRKNTSAERAGLRTGDVVLAINNSPLGRINTFTSLVRRLTPGTSATLSFWRDGATHHASVQLAPSVRVPSKFDHSQPVWAFDKLGLAMGDSGLVGDAEKNPPQSSGAVVLAVKPGSIAERKGLRWGDLVMSVQGYAIRDAAQFRERVQAARKNERTAILVSVWRQGMEVALAIPLADDRDQAK